MPKIFLTAYFRYRTKPLITACFAALAVCSCSKSASVPEEPTAPTLPEETLRQQYSKSVTQWPAATWYNNIKVRELAALPENPSKDKAELVALGKALFFDPRTGNGMKTCASCHNPTPTGSTKKQRQMVSHCITAIHLPWKMSGTWKANSSTTAAQ